MKFTDNTLIKLILTFVAFANIGLVVAEEEKAKRPMTQEEIDSSIGRMGEVETIPEGFEFSETENILWKTDHLANIEKPLRIYYEFVKSGSYEEGFQDAVYLDILTINEDGSKNANLEFFTADRKQNVKPSNVTNIVGNPVLGIYMQGDVYEMDRYTGGSWRHFIKRLKISFREDAIVEPITFEYNGRNYNGKKYSVRPYLNDPRRRRYEDFAQKSYEFIFADEIPGQLYQIHTVIPGKEGEDEAMIEETLTLMEVNSR